MSNIKLSFFRTQLSNYILCLVIIWNNNICCPVIKDLKNFSCGFKCLIKKILSSLVSVFTIICIIYGQHFKKTAIFIWVFIQFFRNMLVHQNIIKQTNAAVTQHIIFIFVKMVLINIINSL